WLTVGCDRPIAGISSQTQTGSSDVASRLTILTRAGSESALKSRAVASASSSDSAAAASGLQHSITVSADIDICKYRHQSIYVKAAGSGAPASGPPAIDDADETAMPPAATSAAQTTSA